MIVLQAETQNGERMRKFDKESESERRDKVVFVCTSLWKCFDECFTKTEREKYPEGLWLNLAI